MFSKGDLIRCTTDGDIGVVLSTSTEIRKMYIYWFFDGFRRAYIQCRMIQCRMICLK